MKVEDVLALPPVEWKKVLGSLDDQGLMALNYEAASQIIGTARLFAYTEAVRRGYDHDKAVAHTNRFDAKIRKLLGYSYPHLGAFPF